MKKQRWKLFVSFICIWIPIKHCSHEPDDGMCNVLDEEKNKNNNNEKKNRMFVSHQMHLWCSSVFD